MTKYLKDNLQIIMKWANVIFLFLFSLHFFNFPDKYIILWCMFAGIVFYLQNKKTGLDITFLFLTLAVMLNGIGTLYYLGEELSYTWKDIIKLVVPTILVYPFAKQVAYEKNDRDIEVILLTIVVGTFLYSLLNHYSYIFYGNGLRMWSEFWTKYRMNATHHSYWGCFIAGILGYGIWCLFNKKCFKGILIVCFVLIENYIQIVVGNRMVLCVTALSLLMSLVLFLFLNLKNKKKIKFVVFGGIIVIVVLVAAISLNVFGIRSSEYFQNFFTRDGGIMNNIRFRMIYEAITMLPSHWKGGANMWAAGWYWVHNYWLQVANVSGIIPFILWMIVNIGAVIDTIKLIKSRYINDQIKYILIPMITSIVGYLMMEPGGTELNRYIIFYVILIAILKQLANKDKSGVKNV